MLLALFRLNFERGETMIMLTPAEFEDKMKEIKEVGFKSGDPYAAEKLMCEALEDNGYYTGVKLYREMRGM